MPRPLRLVVFDATCRRHGMVPSLSTVWRLGGTLYRALGRVDACYGALTWPDALEWLASVSPGRPIGEVQLWAHGEWGRVFLGGDVLDEEALRPGHPLNAPLQAVRGRMAGPEALWWFRTCKTFGAEPGRRFACAWPSFLGCRAAGHTHVIGFYQSGLHSLTPGEMAGWFASEGLAEGAPWDPLRSRGSGRRRPHTITCLHGRVPDGW